jgi:ABC-type tungstate transport system substrate-binding protein
VELIWEGIKEAFRLLFTLDPEVLGITWLSLKVSGLATLVCTAPSCLDQTLASGRLLGKPGFTGFLRCAPA